MAKLEYTKEVVDLINELAIINPSIILEKKENDVYITRTNASTTIAYRFSVNEKTFNFEGNEIAFYDFSEFYQLLSCFSDPIMEQKEAKVIIQKDKSKINYNLSDVETIKRGPAKLDWKDPAVTLSLTMEEIKSIRKMIGLLKVENAKLSCKAGELEITLHNAGHDNSFSKIFKAETITNLEDFEFSIASEIFTMLPQGDYELGVMDAGLVRFKLESENVNLELFTAETEV